MLLCSGFVKTPFHGFMHWTSVTGQMTWRLALKRQVHRSLPGSYVLRGRFQLHVFLFCKYVCFFGDCTQTKRLNITIKYIKLSSCFFGGCLVEPSQYNLPGYTPSFCMNSSRGC